MDGCAVSPFLGQEVIAHRWNLQWAREWGRRHPHRVSAPQALGRTRLLAGPVSFSSTALTAFSFAPRTTAPFAVHLGLV